MLKNNKKKSCKPRIRIPRGVIILNSLKQQKYLLDNDISSTFSNSFNPSKLL